MTFACIVKSFSLTRDICTTLDLNCPLTLVGHKWVHRWRQWHLPQNLAIVNSKAQVHPPSLPGCWLTFLVLEKIHGVRWIQLLSATKYTRLCPWYLPYPTLMVTAAESGTRMIPGLWFFWHMRKQQRKSLPFLERELTAYSGLRSHQASFDKTVLADVWIESCHQFQPGRSSYLPLSVTWSSLAAHGSMCVSATVSEKGITSPGIIHRCFFHLPGKVSSTRHSKALGIFSSQQVLSRDTHRWELIMMLSTKFISSGTGFSDFQRAKQY